MKDTKNVALVLSSGGARGYAHIGAIEALEQRGYRITSVAGASMGAAVGGMYCAGRLDEVKRRFTDLSTKEIMQLVDFTIGRNHMVKGDRVIEALRRIVPDVKIENLPIPFRAIASDLETQREVVFSKGSLYRALRASISIPTVFRPLKIGRHVLVDGGVANPLPINRVPRLPDGGDLLVSVNVSAPASEEVEALKSRSRKQQAEGRSLFSLEGLQSAIAERFEANEVDSSYFSVMLSTMTMLIQRNTVLAQKLYPTDMSVNIPMNRFAVFDFGSLDRISRAGFEAMNEAINIYEQGAK